MDLAKIRKKAHADRCEPAESPEESRLDAASPAPLRDEPEVPLPPVQAVQERAGTPTPVPVEPAAVPDVPVEPPRRRAVGADPLQIILAGREAAGCDVDQLIEEAHESDEDYDEFLCIRVSNELYGINIMEIKEIIKPREVTEVPRAPSFVAGVISLRGVIIPIIDLLVRLGLNRGLATGRERVVVVRNGDEFVGLLVDEVTQVVRINRSSFESAPAVLDGIDRDFVAGIGRADNGMIIMLNTESIADINMY